MNGTPTVSWQRLCAIDRVKLKVPNQVSKVRSSPYRETRPVSFSQVFARISPCEDFPPDLVTFNFTLSIAHSLCQLAVGVS